MFEQYTFFSFQVLWDFSHFFEGSDAQRKKLIYKSR